jgi:putative ABC transport system permease protein
MSGYDSGLSIHLLVAEAFEALADNRLRTVLSLLGVAIGIASIIVVSSIASSGREMVFQELETFGLRTFWVFRTSASDERLEKDVAGSGIDTADFKELLRRELPSISRLSPVVEPGGESVIAAKNARTVRVRLQGVNQDFNQINGDEVLSGRFLSADDVTNHLDVAVIGPDVAEKLFPSGSDVIGQTFSIGDTWFRVIGVLRGKSRDLITSLGAGGGEETRARILIPYTAHQKLIGDSDFVSYLQGQSTGLNRSDEAMHSIIGVLNVRHRNAFSYKGESMSTYVTITNNILGGVSMIGIVAAAVSLLVGGLAIMNIMTTSVIERTKEIGLRRAIGASQFAIRAQFLVEAVLISSAGGLIGILFGLGIVHAVALFSTLVVDVSFDGILLAMLSTFAVGLTSGYYPALTASRLEPVEALRHE